MFCRAEERGVAGICCLKHLETPEATYCFFFQSDLRGDSAIQTCTCPWNHQCAPRRCTASWGGNGKGSRNGTQPGPAAWSHLSSSPAWEQVLNFDLRTDAGPAEYILKMQCLVSLDTGGVWIGSNRMSTSDAGELELRVGGGERATPQYGTARTTAAR